MTTKTYRIYLRLSEEGKVSASTKPIYESLSIGSSNKKYVPTLQIALDLKIDTIEFSAARILLEQNIEKVVPAVEINEVEIRRENE